MQVIATLYKPLRGVARDEKCKDAFIMESSRYLLQNIFSAYANYLQNLSQPLKNIKAINAITKCRTPALGTRYFSCDQHHVLEQHYGCHHRSCFICAQKSQAQWIDTQRARIFNAPHFHVVFTLPHEYLNLWRYNAALFTHFIFQASRETLMELMEDNQYHGVTPGILMALHTWGRQLSLHPHTHCLVTAGGLTAQGEWREIQEYLLPIKVVKKLYRGKMQALIKGAFESGALKLPPDMNALHYQRLFNMAYQKEWSVRIEERYEHGKGVLLYLARYFKGGPINPAQIERCRADEIVFRYLDHRDKRTKSLRLSPQDFLKRLLDHVPENGVHTVRHFGLYASSNKARREHCRALLGDLSCVNPAGGTKTADMILSCKVCGGLTRHTHSIWRRFDKGISIIKERPGGFVQQSDEPDIAYEPSVRDPCVDSS
jgi:hypothetical protein